MGGIAPKLFWEKEVLSNCRKKKTIRDMEKFHENSAPTLSNPNDSPECILTNLDFSTFSHILII